MTEINHNKRLSEVLSHAKCPRCNSNDKEAIAYIGDNYNLRSNIVGTNGLKAGVQVWQKKIKHCLSNG
jgi:hypothetical protein